MRVFCIHPRDDYNIGDLMTFYGAKHLVTKVWPDAEFLQFDIRRAEAEIDSYIPQYNWGDDVDLILLAGSPWVARNGESLKYRMVKQAKGRWPDAKKMALGIGSFISIRQVEARDYNKIDLSFLAGFDLVIARDAIAYDILQDAGLRCRLDYDTSIYSKFGLSHGSESNNALVYYDPGVHDVWDHFAQRSKRIWQEVVDYQLDWAETNCADIYVVDSGDKGSLMSKGIEGRFVADLEWMAARLSKAHKVLTPKVHQSVLAMIMGCKDVTLLPVDSRAYTVRPLGIRVKAVGFDLPATGESYSRFKLSKLNSYAREIAGYMRESYEN